MNIPANITTPVIPPSSGVNVNISNPPQPQQPNPFNNLFATALIQPKHSVQQVNDEKEIYSIPMGVDSNDFILHATKPLIYFVVTDSSGNKTSITPFEIKQYIPEPEPTMQDVKAIEAKFEERFASFKNEISDMISNKLEEVLK